MAAPRAGNADNLRPIFLDYVADVFAARAPEAETVCVWDLCNEPWLHYQDTDCKVRAGFLRILEGAAAALRSLGARSPITYDADAPGDLCFIRRDGSLRSGHDAINAIATRYPVPRLPFCSIRNLNPRSETAG